MEEYHFTWAMAGNQLLNDTNHLHLMQSCSLDADRPYFMQVILAPILHLVHEPYIELLRLYYCYILM